ATLFFQIAHYCIRPWPWIIVGLCAIVLYPELGIEEKRLGYVYAMKDFLPVGLKGLLLAAFFAAYMSTISTQLNWGASYIVNDLYKPFIAKEASEKRLVLVSRITTLALMGFALWITTLLESITGVWIFLYEAGAGLGLVLILRWYWWRINAWTEITASLTPFVFYAISRYVLHLEFPQSYFLTVGATTVAWVTIMYLTKPESRETLESFYKRVLPEGFWSPVKSGLNIMIKDSRLPWRIASWLSAIVLGYSVLFLIGKMIFHEWDYALLHFGVALAGLTGMIFSMSKQSKKE
ncbi:MAG: sodium:proline symporter, partial [Bacteroidetes bacterium]|nr:sodium:proline symporter [Bacteroidota bacterium]